MLRNQRLHVRRADRQHGAHSEQHQQNRCRNIPALSAGLFKRLRVVTQSAVMLAQSESRCFGTTGVPEKRRLRRRGNFGAIRGNGCEGVLGRSGSRWITVRRPAPDTWLLRLSQAALHQRRKCGWISDRVLRNLYDSMSKSAALQGPVRSPTQAVKCRSG